MDFLKQIDPMVTIFIVILVLVISFILLRSKRHSAAKREEEPKQSPSDNTAHHTVGGQKAHPLDAAPDMDQEETRIADTTRELDAQLDSKMCALQALITEADRAAARLEAALKREPETPADRIPSRRSPLFNPQPGILAEKENS